MQQAGVADRDGGFRFVDKISVEPGAGHWVGL
jgi:hypothetical protein